jgi:hypothetical protein
MKKIKQEGNKYTIQFEKTELIEQVFEKEFIQNKIAEIDNKISLMIADKAKYEEILSLMK